METEKTTEKIDTFALIDEVEEAQKQDEVLWKLYRSQRLEIRKRLHYTKLVIAFGILALMSVILAVLAKLLV